MTNLEKRIELIKSFPVEKNACYINHIRTRNRPCLHLTCQQCWKDSIDWLLEEAEEEDVK